MVQGSFCYLVLGHLVSQVPPGPLDKVWMAETKAPISLACIEPWKDALTLQNADFQGLFANESAGSSPRPSEFLSVHPSCGRGSRNYRSAVLLLKFGPLSPGGARDNGLLTPCFCSWGAVSTPGCPRNDSWKKPNTAEVFRKPSWQVHVVSPSSPWTTLLLREITQSKGDTWAMAEKAGAREGREVFSPFTTLS